MISNQKELLVKKIITTVYKAFPYQSAKKIMRLKINNFQHDANDKFVIPLYILKQLEYIYINEY